LLEASSKNFLRRRIISAQTQFDSPTSLHTHWVVIRSLSERFSGLIVEPVNAGPIVGEVVHTARGKVDPSI
jgi:hypothetical protein